MNARIQRSMIIHFNDGTRKQIAFPPPVSDSDGNLAVRIEEALDARYLVLEADGSLLVIPVESIKSIQTYPAPQKLPPFAIRGVRFTD